MSAVDAPPLVPFPGRVAGELCQRRPSIRRARRGLVFSSILGLCTLAVAAHDLRRPLAEFLAIAPFALVSLQVAAYAIRRARLGSVGDRLRWGWAGFGVSITRHRVRAVTAYEQGVAITPDRGSEWFFSARDWGDIEPLVVALADAGFPVGHSTASPPARTRLKSYGLALDILVMVDCIVAVAVLAATLTL